jgi:hypothetical protein
MVAESGAAMMQDVIGIVLLLGTAFLLRFSIHSTAMVHVTVRVIPFNVIAFWVLLSLSLAWIAVAGLVFLVRVL